MAIHGNQTSTIELDQTFLHEVWEGLSGSEKSLSSKYFYDDRGSEIFQEIMGMPEYYLTRCEFEIFSLQSESIGRSLDFDGPFQLIELGAGDGSKTFKLIEGFQKVGLQFEYLPVDVSAGALTSLETSLLSSGLKVEYRLMEGDYFEVMNSLGSDVPALYLFLGANIGNYNQEQAQTLLKKIQANMKPGDMLLTGFDLKKNPMLVQQAYADPHGITARFNLNLLSRMNRELGADFKLDQFEFYSNYCPDTGEVKSYLVSLKAQEVQIGGKSFKFDRFELIYTELSKKYSLNEIENLASATRFQVKNHFLDCQHYFTDSLWQKQ